MVTHRSLRFIAHLFSSMFILEKAIICSWPRKCIILNNTGSQYISSGTIQGLLLLNNHFVTLVETHQSVQLFLVLLYLSIDIIMKFLTDIIRVTTSTIFFIHVGPKFFLQFGVSLKVYLLRKISCLFVSTCFLYPLCSWRLLERSHLILWYWAQSTARQNWIHNLKYYLY